MRNQIEFFRQFRQQFKTTGAVAPSSRVLARAMTGPMRRSTGPKRILEIGPGTGAVTAQIVRMLEPGDRLDLVELNDSFVDILQRRFETEKCFSEKSSLCGIHHLPLQEFQSSKAYDFVISGLPLNNFDADLVSDIFDSYFRLLAPNGMLSYFEYMFVRNCRQSIGKKSERQRLCEVDGVIQPFLRQHRVATSWVFMNVPPAWVQHLQNGHFSPAPVPST